MPGMRTSMITTSGLRRWASATALAPSDGLADHADVRRAREREPQAFADDLVVVDDQACDLVRPSRGIDAEIGVPGSHTGARAAPARLGLQTHAPAIADPVLARELGDRARSACVSARR